MAHRHPANVEHYDKASPGARAADWLVAHFGSWAYILTQTAAVVVWVTGNAILLTRPFDPYPFILLNLMFSTQASYAAPLILMAQNRAAEHDRIRAEHDHEMLTDLRELVRCMHRAPETGPCSCEPRREA